MHNFMTPILSALQIWVNKRLKNNTSDWNQSDSNADGYIKNRPFYTKNEEVAILPEHSANDGDSSIIKKSLTVGTTYIVTFDGVDYETVCRYYDGYKILGNNAIYEYDNGVTTDSGEPFALEENGSSREMFFYFQDKTIPHTVKIITYTEAVKKIDKKYLPKETVLESDLASVAYSGDYYSLNNIPAIATDIVRHDTTQYLSATNKNTAKSNIGAVGYDSAQTLTEAQKEQARTNIGAGTSNFSGSYNDLTNKPTIEPQKQSDWAIKDTNDETYIKNRPMYHDETWTHKGLMKNASADSEYNDTGLYYGRTNGSSYDLSDYKWKCKINNGTTWVGKGRKVLYASSTYQYYTVIGNAYLGVEIGIFKDKYDNNGETIVDTGEDWMFVSTTSTAAVWIYSRVQGRRVDAFYTLESEDLKQLDPKYLPDGTPVVPVTTEDNGKVLGVVDGKFKLVGASCQPVVFTATDNNGVLSWRGAGITSFAELINQYGTILFNAVLQVVHGGGTTMYIYRVSKLNDISFDVPTGATFSCSDGIDIVLDADGTLSYVE